MLDLICSITGSRYVQVEAASRAAPLAVAVRGDPSDARVSCISAFVETDGTLGPTPRFRPAEAWEGIYIHGPEVIPSALYTYWMVSGNGACSLPVSVLTGAWGDVDGTGEVDVDDVLCVLDALMGISRISCPLQGMDLLPCVPDGIVGQDDFHAVLDAFGGTPFPCSGPCQPSD